MKINKSILQKKHLDAMEKIPENKELIAIECEQYDDVLLGCEQCFFEDTCSVSDSKNFTSICELAEGDVIYLLDKKEHKC